MKVLGNHATVSSTDRNESQGVAEDDPGKRAPKPERLNDIPARKEDTFHHRTMATIKHCTLFNNKKVKHKWAGDRVLFSIPIETP